MSASNDQRYDRRSPRDRRLRAGDKERDAVSEILRRRHVEGRLDNDEFQTRLERCLTAKTYADLDGLIADFPPDPSEQAGRTPRTWRPHPWPIALLPLALVAAIVWSGGHLAWLVVPLVFFLAVRTFGRCSWAGSSRGGWGCGPRYPGGARTPRH